MVQAPPQMTVLASQAMPYPLTFQPQPGAPPGQLMPSADYADLGEGFLCSTHEHCQLRTASLVTVPSMQRLADAAWPGVQEKREHQALASCAGRGACWLAPLHKGRIWCVDYCTLSVTGGSHVWVCAGGGGLLSGASAQDKNLAFSKVVRKAYRTVFKRVIRPLLNRNFSNQLPLCTSNHCIVLPGQPPHASRAPSLRGHVYCVPFCSGLAAGCLARAHAGSALQSGCPVGHAGPGKQCRRWVSMGSRLASQALCLPCSGHGGHEPVQRHDSPGQQRPQCALVPHECQWHR